MRTKRQINRFSRLGGEQNEFDRMNAFDNFSGGNKTKDRVNN